MNDNSEERDTGLPPVGTPEELEEALKWLEDLTARQGKPADLSNPVPAASIDSPFRGLIDSEDGDLPDWLREVPAPISSEGMEETEPESRLDWLAKMAQRESIEELPTLEWRRLSEPLQNAILADQNIDLLSRDDQVVADETGISPEPDPIIEEEDTRDAEELSLDPTAEELPPTETVESYIEAEQTEIITEVTAEPDESAGEIGLEVPAQEETDEYYGTPPPPVDDLDAAMAWIEELAASQDAPIEEVPSVADRALASKLMMEAGLTPNVSPLDELGSDSSLIDGITPTHPFIEEEDYADTVVLVETLAADQGNDLPLMNEPNFSAVPVVAQVVLTHDEALIQESIDQNEVPADLTATDELSFEEAMALLDQMAVEQSNENIDSDIMLNRGTEEATVDSSFESSNEIPPIEAPPMEITEPEEVTSDLDITANEATPWMDDSGTYTSIGPVIVDEEQVLPIGQPTIATNGAGYSNLEGTLLMLDALALPPGKTLNDIDVTLRAARTTSWRDLNSALEWLESALLGKSAPAESLDLDDAALIAQMPEDPDEVLAWLEGMAAEEENRISTASTPSLHDPVDVIPAALKPEPLVKDLAEADLLNMPDDPDEAMAWLEGLARDSSPSVEPYSPNTGEAAVTIQAHEVELIEPEVGEIERIAEEQGYIDEVMPPEIVEESGAYYDQPIIDEQPLASYPDDMPEISHPDIPAEENAPAETTPAAELIFTPNTESVLPDDDPVPTTYETVEEQPLVDSVMDEPMAKPARKRTRTRSTKPETESQTLDTSSQAIADEVTIGSETVDEAPADEKPRVPSWLDLLKPLE